MPGEVLSPERWPPDIIAKNKRESTSHAWATQYNQQASERAGGMFKRHWWKYVPAAPAGARRVRRWDFACTEDTGSNDPDWLVGLLMAEFEGTYYVEEILRSRETPHGMRALLHNTATKDGVRIPISIPQDPAQAGKDQVQSIISSLAGWVVTAKRETGSKETRAEPFAAQVEAGNVCLVNADWRSRFIGEHDHA